MAKDEIDVLRGIAKQSLTLVKHVVFEVGPSPDALWAFRTTIHPFRNQKEALEGVEKMKKLLRPLGFKFQGEPE